MCGIVGAVAQRSVTGILLEGLKRLEYRGYDSSGVAIIDKHQQLQRRRHAGKVAILEQDLQSQPLAGTTGIAHTRWATHGVPSDSNAHPHCSDHIAVVHNGIIENHQKLRDQLLAQGYQFSSETDTEVVAHLLHHHYHQLKDQQDILLKALQATIAELEGAFALAVISSRHHDELVASRRGSPLVLGKGIGEMFVSSDTLALRQVSDQFVYLDEGDIVHLKSEGVCHGYKADGESLTLNFQRLDTEISSADKGDYRHFMEKEINEQPKVVKATVEGFIGKQGLIVEAFGLPANQLFKQIKAVQIVACGSSYYAALVARNWFESYAKLPCQVEIASEYLYRENYVVDDCLFVTISQSGETADTLSALRKSQQQNYVGSFAICNVPNSSLVREVDSFMLTQAGFEISVASTKAFMTQLVALQLLVMALGKYHQLDAETERSMVDALRQLPSALQTVLNQHTQYKQLAKQFINDHNMLFLGRGTQFPIACEGALKMKEISYIHAEAYASGELKHGPLALVDEHMPVIAIAPNDALLDKLKSNLKEVEARGGRLYVIADESAVLDGMHAIHLPSVPDSIIPMVYTVPLQLLAYQVALIKGNDVDQPRNLAKSVTVE